MEGCQAGRRSKGLGRDVQVVVIPRVQSHLREEPAEPIEKAISAQLRRGRSHPQDP
jgi:hypothetical protein